MRVRFTYPGAKRNDMEFEHLGACVCGGQIGANVEQGAVMHTEPHCAAFESLDPTEFLAYIRRSRGIPDDAVKDAN